MKSIMYKKTTNRVELKMLIKNGNEILNSLVFIELQIKIYVIICNYSEK